MREDMNESGYIIDPETGKRVVFYECDPSKNFLCDKLMCRASGGQEDEALGFCASTREERFRKEGIRPFYKRLNKDGYFSREYIGEGKEK